ncbi:MAG: hypothetical protein IKB98_10385 [Clostridia bacterium]|nr:hypothetical protein [Clostridia bacterium]
MKGKNKKQGLNEQEIKLALAKKALGYDATEVVEEYVLSEQGEVQLTKRKVTTKSVPPDVSALKVLMEGHEKDISEWTDEQLEKEKQRLLKMLDESQKGEQ